MPAQFGVAQGALAAALLLYPLVASEFFLTQIGAYSLIWGLLALSMMLLAGYGGMVSLAQITSAGIAAYTVAIFGTNNMNIYGFGWPWWVLVPFAVLLAAITLGDHRCDFRPHRRHLHDHDYARDRRRLLLLRAAELRAVQRSFRLMPAFPRRRSAGIDWRAPMPFYYLCLFVAAGCYAAVLYCSRSTFGLALQAIRDNGRRMRAVGFDITAHKVVAYFYSGIIAGLAGVLARLVQRPGIARHRRCRSGHQGAGHRRDRRAAPSDRPVPRRSVRDPDPDVRHRYRRRRTLQYADRFSLSGDRFRLAGWSPGPVGKNQAPARAGDPCVPACSGERHFVHKHNQHKGGWNDRTSTHASGVRPRPGGGTDNPVRCDGRRHHQNRRARHVRRGLRHTRRRQHARRPHGRRRFRRQGRRQEDRDHQRLVRRFAGQRGSRDPQVGRAGWREGPGRSVVGRRRPGDEGLRQDQAGRDLRQRHVGRAGYDVARSGAELLPLLHRRRAMDGGPRRLRLQRQALQERGDLGGRLFLSLHAGVRLHGAVLQGRRPCA